jgi:DNA-binding NtrC family response regulator
VRELENAVERSLILSEGKPLQFEQIIPSTIDQREVPALAEMEARHIRMALEKTGGKVEGNGGAAELLGIHPGTLRHRMRKLGIPFGRKAKQARVRS